MTVVREPRLVHWVSGIGLVALLTTMASGCADDDSGANDSTASTATGGNDDSPSQIGDSSAGTADETASNETAADETASDETAATPDPRLAITADWQAGTLSLLDLELLAGGATTRDEILVDTVDLSMYAPGPLQLELTPDGETAVVSVSPGFFEGFVGNLIGVGDVAGGGLLLIVDIPTRQVIAELAPAHVPMGIAISADGTTAYTANYGTSAEAGSTMTIVDLTTQTIVEDITVGGRPEQVSLSSDGSLGIINLAADGTVRVFETSDPAGTLSTPLPTADDPSDVDFIEGTSYAIVANSVGPSVYSIIDVTDPSAPTLVEDAPPPGGVLYGATPIPGTSDAIITASDFDQVILLRVGAGQTPSSVAWQLTLPMTSAFPLGVAVEPALNLALIGAPGADLLVVVGLDGEGLRTIDWLAEKGPTYVAIQAE